MALAPSDGAETPDPETPSDGMPDSAGAGADMPSAGPPTPGPIGAAGLRPGPIGGTFAPIPGPIGAAGAAGLSPGPIGGTFAPSPGPIGGFIEGAPTAGGMFDIVGRP